MILLTLPFVNPLCRSHHYQLDKPGTKVGFLYQDCVTPNQVFWANGFHGKLNTFFRASTFTFDSVNVLLVHALCYPHMSVIHNISLHIRALVLGH